MIYKPKDLLNTGDELFQHVVRFAENNPRGFGYWLWKPALLLRELETLTDETGIVWLDCGSTLNLGSSAARNRWFFYEKAAIENNYLFFSLPSSPHRKWTKREAFLESCLTDDVNDKNQYWAGAFFLSNSLESKELLRSWLNFAMRQDGFFLSDELDARVQLREFVEHRHDQSLLSLCLENIKYKSGINDESYFDQRWKTLGTDHPIWATRLRSKFNSVSQSLLAKFARKIERGVFNYFSTFDKQISKRR